MLDRKSHVLELADRLNVYDVRFIEPWTFAEDIGYRGFAQVSSIKAFVQWSDTRKSWLANIPDPSQSLEAYYCALHELGHCATYPSGVFTITHHNTAEVEAWAWALEQALGPLTADVVLMIREGLRSYGLDGEGVRTLLSSGLAGCAPSDGSTPLSEVFGLLLSEVEDYRPLASVLPDDPELSSIAVADLFPGQIREPNPSFSHASSPPLDTTGASNEAIITQSLRSRHPFV